jgi:energy-coupling factor transporter ATP-binding protein EcfA2
LIERLRVANFRSIHAAEVDCDRLTALIGRNGAGKSSLLRALDVFYNVSAALSIEDFFNRDASQTIELQVTFTELSTMEATEFAHYVQDNKLTVTKRITLAGISIDQRYYAATQQIAEFARIRALASKRERVAAWRELVRAGALPDLSGPVRSADDVERLMAGYENDHPDRLELVEREEQFFGPRNIGGGKLDKYTKFVLIPAVRDASEEIGGRKAAIYQILDALVLRKLSAREDVQAFRMDFEGRAKGLFGPATDAELRSVASSLSTSLVSFAPGASLQLSWGDVSVPEIQPPPVKVSLVEDEFAGDIEHKGHGLQRALVLTLLRELALMGQPEDVASYAPDGTGPEPSSTPITPTPALILAIEEPELFLHPSRCRYLSTLLLDLALQTDGGQNQIIYTTHSPHFVDLRRFNQIRRVEKSRVGGHPTPETRVLRFSLREAAGALAEVCDRDPASFTSESFATRAAPVMTQAVNEGFFADAAVLVEGPSEVAALWKLQELQHVGWDEHGIAVIPVSGKSNLDRPSVILRGLGVPIYVVFDADRQNLDAKNEEETRKANRICLRLVGAETSSFADADFPETQVHATWATFEYELETLLERELGDDALTALISHVADEIGSDRSRRALKNGEVMSRVIEHAYDNGLRLPTLENIVDEVTKLVTATDAPRVTT